MLKKILSPASCAECRWCCQFDENDIWEMPVLPDNTVAKIKVELPGAPLKTTGGACRFDAHINPESGLATCPALTAAGCMLGDDKPFDCKIWPFRVMRLCERTAIVMSLGCPALSRLSLSAVKKFLDEGFAEAVFEYAAKNPAIVTDYRDGFIVLRFAS